MLQQNLIYIYKVQKRNEMKKEEKPTGLQWGSAVAAGVLLQENSIDLILCRSIEIKGPKSRSIDISAETEFCRKQTEPK